MRRETDGLLDMVHAQTARVLCTFNTAKSLYQMCMLHEIRHIGWRIGRAYDNTASTKLRCIGQFA